MSLNVLTQGVGTGGESASIFITGLSETDIVTATKDGKTVNGRWVSEPNPYWHDLPEGCTPVEYIESTGTQYIDLGFVPNLQMTVALDVKSTTLPSTSEYQMGSRDANSSGTARYFNIIVPSSVDTFNIGLGSAERSSGVQKDTDRHTFILDAYNMRYGVDDTYISLDALSELPDVSFYVCARNTSGSANYFASMRVYGVTVYESGQLTRRYVPCNNKGVLGLYDLVNDVFYTNVGTGEFIAGAEVQQHFQHHTIKIKEYGLWTVTATNGEKTTTQDVLVDAAVEYEIEMGYRLWLYREGEEFEDVTGGWLPYSSGTQQQYAVFQTKNEIDTTQYEYLHAIYQRYDGTTINVGMSNGLVRPSGTKVNDWFGWYSRFATGVAVSEPSELVIPLDEKTVRSGYITVGNTGDTGYSSTMTTQKNDDHLFTQHLLNSITYWGKCYAVWLE